MCAIDCPNCVMKARQAMPSLSQIHVTVQWPINKVKFSKVCDSIGVKAITVANRLPNEKVLLDSFTSSVSTLSFGPPLMEEVGRIAQLLQKYGFTVIRKKIEVPPWHLSVPTHAGRAIGSYFEAHIKCDKKYWGRLDLPSSENCRTRKRIFTHRLANVTLSEFSESLRYILRDIKTSEVMTEWVPYDTNLEHDKLWINGI